MGVETLDRDICDTMTSESQDLTSALKNESNSMANLGEHYWSPANKEKYINSLTEHKEELVRQRELIHAQLGKVDPLVGGILNMDSLAVASLIDSHKDDQWMKFQFDSESEENNIGTSHQSFYSGSGLCIGIGSCIAYFSSSRSSTSKSYQNDLAQASLKVKGKLLRVYIKRPWFKPEFFDDRKLSFVSCMAN